MLLTLNELNHKLCRPFDVLKIASLGVYCAFYEKIVRFSMFIVDKSHFKVKLMLDTIHIFVLFKILVRRQSVDSLKLKASIDAMGAILGIESILKDYGKSKVMLMPVGQYRP